MNGRFNLINVSAYIFEEDMMKMRVGGLYVARLTLCIRSKFISFHSVAYQKRF